MTGRIVECSKSPTLPTIAADVGIIGSGAAGAILAHELAARGLRVVVVERGAWRRSVDFNQREVDMFAALWKMNGVQFAANFTVNVAQGQCVGGSTVINDAICFRTPPDVLQEWRDQHGIPWASEDRMRAHFDELWAQLRISRVKDESLNRNNLKLRQGTRALGWSGGNNERNCVDCRECGYCHLGCHYDTKQSMLVTYVPWSLDAGVDVYADCRAERIVVRNGKATELVCRVLQGGKKTRRVVRVRAKAFVVSAGAIASSELLLRSGLGNENVGHSIGFHPSPAILARYEEEINGFAGIPMSYHVDQFRRIDGRPGFLIEGIFIQPAQFSLLLPSLFPTYMRDYAHYTMAGILVWDDQAGIVRLNADGRAVFFYDLTPTNRDTLREAMKRTTEAFFNTTPPPLEVFTSHRIPTRLSSVDDLELIDARGFGPADLTLGSAHPQGGNRMGRDQEVYAVDPDFRPFDAKGSPYPNLYVCDASVFPTTVGVNPQISVMAFALELGKRLEVPRGTGT